MVKKEVLRSVFGGFLKFLPKKLRNNKRALMAIGTLIIFISVILISAIVAGFLIGTTGMLQQRAAYVSRETQSRLTSGVDPINMVGIADLEAETVNYFDLMVRLKAGSDPINLQYLNMIMTTQDKSFPMTLQGDFLSTYGTHDVGEINNVTFATFADIDNDRIDEKVDIRIIEENVSLSNGSIELQNLTYLFFDLSSEGEFNISIPTINNVDVNNSVHLKLEDVPIRFNEDTYGFIQADTNIINNNTIESGELKITEYPTECTFNTLMSPNKFCYTVQLGNDNTILEKGEILYLRFFLGKGNGLPIDSSYSLQIVPKTGIIEQIESNIPSILVLKKVVLYP